MSRRNVLILSPMSLSNFAAVLVLAFPDGVLLKVMAAWWISSMLTLGGLIPIGSLMGSGSREEFDVES